MKPTQTKPSIVFCHGIWADGSCFNKVIPTLQAEGHQVIAAQYGLDSLASDVATVKRTLGRVSSPAILVGHSYGGSVITAAGTDDLVVGLVYIAALARMPTKRRRVSRTSSPEPMFSPTSKSPTVEPGCFRKASSASPETCLNRRRRSSGPRTSRQLRTSSTMGLRAPPGDRSRAGTLLAKTTAPSIPNSNASQRSAWVPQPMRLRAVTCPCSPNRNG